jgi:hypothetical protein
MGEDVGGDMEAMMEQAGDSGETAGNGEITGDIDSL